MPRFVTSLAAVAALSLIAACGGDDDMDDSSGSTVATTADASPSGSAATETAPDSGVETTTGMVDEPGNPEVSVDTTDGLDDSTSSTASTMPIDDPSGSDAGHTSADLQEYIASLAATTDDFDGLTTTPEETTCAATAVLTPIGVDLLQQEGVTVENVNLELDLLELATPESAAGIADGLVACGLGPRFAASLAESETAEDLDEAGQLALRDCVQAQLDDVTARGLLVGFLTPATDGSTMSPERAEAGSQMATLVRGCGVESRYYP